MIDQILEDKITRIEGVLSSVHNSFANVVRTSEAVPMPGEQPGAPAATQPATNTPATNNESEIIQKVLDKIKTFTSKIEQSGGSAPQQGGQEPAPAISLAASTRVAVDEQTKQRYYQPFIDWVKNSLKPYLDSKQGNGVDKAKVLQGLKSRISAELPQWKDFIFKLTGGADAAPAAAPAPVTAHNLFDESIFSATESDIRKVADVITALEVFAADGTQPDITQMLTGFFREADFINAIKGAKNPKQESDAAVKQPNSTLSNKIAALMTQHARSIEETDLPAFIVKNSEKEIQASAQSFVGPLLNEIKFIQTQFSNYLRKKGKNIPVDVITKNPSILLGIETILEKLMYGYSVLDPVSIGKSCCGTVVPSVTTPDAVLEAVFKRAGDIIVSQVGPALGKGATAQASVSQEMVFAVLNTYFDKFVYVASNLETECSVDELVYALTGNPPADPYNRIVSDFISYRFSDVRKAEELVNKIQPVVEKNPEMLDRFYNDYNESAESKVQEFQQSTGISDTIINNVLKDKLLDENSLKELQKFISDSVKNETENVDPEEKEEATGEVEDFVEESGVSPEMTAVVVNSEISGVVHKLFSEVSLENQARIASSESALEKIFAYLDTEIKKIDKRYSKSNIMLLFDPEKGGFYTKEMSDIAPEEKGNIQKDLGSSDPMGTPGDEELSFPTGNEFGGAPATSQSTPQTQPAPAPAGQPAESTPGQSESEFEQALK